MTASEVKAILFTLFVIGLLLFGYVAWGWHQAAEANGKTAEQLSGTAVATSAVSTGAATAQAQAAHVDITVHQAQDEFTHAYQDLEQHNATVRGWGDVTLPPELLQLACERRAARDRLAGLESGSGRADDASARCGDHPAPGPSEDRSGASGGGAGSG